LTTEEQLVQAVGELHGFERIANPVRWARASRAHYLAGATLWQRSDYFRSLTAGRWPLVNSTPAFYSAFSMAAGVSGSPPSLVSTFDYTIHTNSRAFSFAASHAWPRNSANVRGARGSLQAQMQAFWRPAPS
jgi:hypothetical protein